MQTPRLALYDSTSLALLLLAAACGADPQAVAVGIAPPSALLAPGGTQQFTATVSGALSTAVTFSVEEAGGGAVDAAGLYTAPAATGVFHVVARAQADTSKQARAEVTVQPAVAVDATVTVDTAAGRRPISPFVYGYNAGRAADAPAGATWLRLGGNRWTAYNWTNNYSNAGSDYGPYHNDTFMGAPADGPGAAAAGTLDDAKAHGLGVLVTIPMQGWVSKDASGNVSVSSPLTDHFVQTVPAKGSAFTLTPSPTSAPVYQDEFANFCAARWGSGAAGLSFSLDNEPDLWADTHAEIQRTPLTYADLLSKSVATASALKRAVPSALVFGPASYGWAGYLNLQGAPDAGANGDFLDYYLARFAAASSTRLLDALDLHFYSEARGCGVRVNDAGAAARNSDCVVAARVQSTRSLWDPSYKEDSWITGCCSGGEGIRLVPRMLAKIAARYPGTRLALTEYNHGGGDHVSGAVAQADTLGALGREGVFAASFWGLGSSEAWSGAAFRAFRNYDGAGKSFGDTSVSAGSSDVKHLAAWAAVDSAAPDRVVVVLVHRPGAVTNASGQVTGGDGLQSRTVRVAVQHATALGKVRGWQLGPGAAPAWVALSPALAGGQVTLTLPALSVTTLELTP